MSRGDDFKTMTNPAKKFLSWKSTEKVFVYYDKEKKENVSVKLPLRLAFVKKYSVVNNWSQKLDGKLIGNEVSDLKRDVMTVNLWKRGAKKPIEFAKGIWSEIKDKLTYNGGKYTLSVYAVTEKGELINLQLNGSGLGNIFDVINDRTLLSNYLEIAGTKQKKSGAVVYNEPVYKIGEKMPDELIGIADEFYNKIVKYNNDLHAIRSESENKDNDDEGGDYNPLKDVVDNDLPF